MMAGSRTAGADRSFVGAAAVTLAIVLMAGCSGGSSPAADAAGGSGGRTSGTGGQAGGSGGSGAGTGGASATDGGAFTPPPCAPTANTLDMSAPGVGVFHQMTFSFVGAASGSLELTGNSPDGDLSVTLPYLPTTSHVFPTAYTPDPLDHESARVTITALDGLYGVDDGGRIYVEVAGSGAQLRLTITLCDLSFGQVTELDLPQAITATGRMVDPTP